jgi:hypothetical protein
MRGSIRMWHMSLFRPTVPKPPFRRHSSPLDVAPTRTTHGGGASSSSSSNSGFLKML